MWNGKNEVLFFSWNAPLKEVQPWCGGRGVARTVCRGVAVFSVSKQHQRTGGSPKWDNCLHRFYPQRGTIADKVSLVGVPSSGRRREREKKLPTPTAEQPNEVCRYHETISWGVRGFVWGPVLALSEFLEKTRWYRGRKARRKMIGTFCECGEAKG